MKQTPTGRVVSIGQGRDLVLERTFRAAIDDVWASITYGALARPVEGRGRPGRHRRADHERRGRRPGGRRAHRGLPAAPHPLILTATPALCRV